MLSKADLEKYKMLMSILPEDKLFEAKGILAKGMLIGGDASNEAVLKTIKFVMQNADVCIVKDPKEIEGKDLTNYKALIFDCDVENVTDFSKCPKKMFFSKDVAINNTDIKRLPDLSEAIVVGKFSCCGNKKLETLAGIPKALGGNNIDYDTINSIITRINSLEGIIKEFYENSNPPQPLEGAPKKVGGNFNCEELKSLEGAPKKVGENFNCEELKSLEGTPKTVGGDFNCSNEAQEVKATDTKVNPFNNLKRFGRDDR